MRLNKICINLAKIIAWVVLSSQTFQAKCKISCGFYNLRIIQKMQLPRQERMKKTRPLNYCINYEI